MKRVIVLVLTLCSLGFSLSGCKNDDKEEDTQVYTTTTADTTINTGTLSIEEVDRAVNECVEYNKQAFKELIESLKEYYCFDNYYTKEEQDSLSVAYSKSFCENTKNYPKIVSITVMQIQSTEVTCTIETDTGNFIGVFSITELGFRSVRKE